MADVHARTTELRPAVAGIMRDIKGRVLLGRRNPNLPFMGGLHAFPGGAIDAADCPGQPLSAERSRYVDAVALTRELFEETGILLTDGPVLEPTTLHQHRAALLEKRLNFREFLDRHGLAVALDRFVPAGVFVTPETHWRRYHARYYFIDQVSAEQASLIDGELVELDWMTPQQAIELWQSGRLTLAPPVARVLDVLSRFPLQDALTRLQQAEPLTSDHGHLHELRPGIRLIPIRSDTLPPARHTNCVVVGDQAFYVIDPSASTPAEHQRLVRHLDDLIDARQGSIAGILLTHGHRDHVASAQPLRQRYGAPILAHEQTGNRVSFPVDENLADGQCITIAGPRPMQLVCLHTPGHHPGHLCFLAEEQKTLIAGDMIAGTSSIVIAYGKGGNMTDYLDSLNRLLPLEYDLLIPAHGNPMDQPKRVIQRQISHRHKRESMIRDALDRGVTGIDAILADSYADVSVAMRPWAKATLLSHLERLGYDIAAEESGNQ